MPYVDHTSGTVGRGFQAGRGCSKQNGAPHGERYQEYLILAGPKNRINYLILTDLLLKIIYGVIFNRILCRVGIPVSDKLVKIGKTVSAIVNVCSSSNACVTCAYDVVPHLLYWR